MIEQCNFVATGINFPLTVIFVTLIAACAWFSFKTGALYGAELCLASLEEDDIISIDNEGEISPVCTGEEK